MRFLWLAFACVTLSAQDGVPAAPASIEKRMLETAYRLATPVEPQAVQDYVARLGAKLAVQLPAAVPYSFLVVELRENGLPEALALPGGHIFVPLSLLRSAQDEAEFAGMLAQAMARAPLLEPQNFICGDQLACLLYETGALPATLVKQRRGMELRADATAALVVSRAGFDPRALLHYIERVQPADRPDSPLPPRAKRLAALQKAISHLPPTNDAGSDEFYAVQKLARPVQAQEQTANAWATWARPSLMGPSPIR